MAFRLRDSKPEPSIFRPDELVTLELDFAPPAFTDKCCDGFNTKCPNCKGEIGGILHNRSGIATDVTFSLRNNLVSQHECQGSGNCPVDAKTKAITSYWKVGDKKVGIQLPKAAFITKS